MAKLYYRYGAMGSSKTANAIMVRHNYIERGQKVLMAKPQLECRDGAKIGTTISLTAACTTLSLMVGMPSGRSLPFAFTMYGPFTRLAV